ncbi:hypothetical protein K3495_g15938, partial [Podosphaera aphanis]
MINMLRTHFETAEARQKYLSTWRQTTLPRMIAEHPDKTRSECLDLTIDELRRTQQGLSQEYQHEHILKEQVINACQGVKECSLALFNPSDTFEGVCHQLKSSITTWERCENPASFLTEEHEQAQFWTDRKYSGRGQNYGGKSRGNYRGQSSLNNQRDGISTQRTKFQKKCFVCRKYGCWSTQHSAEERKKAHKGYSQYVGTTSLEDYHQFLVRFEGMKDDPFQLEENAPQPDNEVDALLAEMMLEEEGEHQE